MSLWQSGMFGNFWPHFTAYAQNRSMWDSVKILTPTFNFVTPPCPKTDGYLINRDAHGIMVFLLWTKICYYCLSHHSWFHVKGLKFLSFSNISGIVNFGRIFMCMHINCYLWASSCNSNAAFWFWEPNLLTGATFVFQRCRLARAYMWNYGVPAIKTTHIYSPNFFGIQFVALKL